MRLYGQVFLLLAVISTLVYNLYALHELAQTRTPQTDPNAEPHSVLSKEPWSHFKERLPTPLAGDLLCLEMHDHYLAVHSTEGKQLILCRMEDAARELDALGLRVHRSWWVARTAIIGTRKEGQRLFLCLTDGRQVPVGKTYRQTLKNNGLMLTVD